MREYSKRFRRFILKRSWVDDSPDWAIIVYIKLVLKRKGRVV